MRAPKDGSAEPLEIGVGSLYALDDRNVYTVDASGIGRTDLDGAAPEHLVDVADDEPLSGVAVNHETLFWLVQTDAGYRVRQMPKP
jgi:hypothetical protein